MDPSPDISIWGIVSLSALLGGAGSVVANFGIEVYKAKITFSNDVLKKRHELRDTKRLALYEELFKKLVATTLVNPYNTATMINHINDIDDFLTNNLLYFSPEDKQPIYAFTNYFKQIANPTSNVHKNIIVEDQHMHEIMKRFLT